MRWAQKNEILLFLLLAFMLPILIGLDIQGIGFVFVSWLRLLLGASILLFVPGYMMQVAVFPANENLDAIERIGLSFGLSIAIIPPLALLLDYLPWGVSLWPIVIAEEISIVLLGIIAWYRRRAIGEEHFKLDITVDIKGWWEKQNKFRRTLAIVLLASVLLASVSAVFITILPKPARQFTDFYILSTGGVAEEYPRTLQPGETASVVIGITNREKELMTYDVLAIDNGEVIGEINDIKVGNEMTYEQAISFTPISTGKDIRIEFLLYLENQTEPYRYLRLWMTVE